MIDVVLSTFFEVATIMFSVILVETVANVDLTTLFEFVTSVQRTYLRLPWSCFLRSFVGCGDKVPATFFEVGMPFNPAVKFGPAIW